MYVHPKTRERVESIEEASKAETDGAAREMVGILLHFYLCLKDIYREQEGCGGGT